MKPKKILYLCHRIPYPPNKGDKIRSWNQVKFLAQNNDLDLITLADDPADMVHADYLSRVCRRVKVLPLSRVAGKLRGLWGLVTGRSISQRYFFHPEFQKTVDAWRADTNYDAVVCFSSPMAEYVMPQMNAGSGAGIMPQKGGCPSAGEMGPENRKQDSTAAEARARGAENHPQDNGATVPRKQERSFPLLIMDFCDVDSDKWDQYAKSASFPMNFVFRLEGKRLLQYEKKINQTFHRSVFVSEKEARLFQEQFPGAAPLTVVPNGVDHHFFDPRKVAPFLSDNQPGSSAGPSDHSQESPNAATPPLSPETAPNNTAPPVLLFTGAMDYHANVDGVCWFVASIFPRIQKRVPTVRFYIVGSHPSDRVKKLSRRPGVVVTGFVEDIRPYYRAADLCVIPLRIARGVQNKVLEAMSMARPVVTTTMALQGIHAASGKELLTADTAGDFADTVVDLLENPATIAGYGPAARRFVKRHYDWDHLLERFYNACFRE